MKPKACKNFRASCLALMLVTALARTAQAQQTIDLARATIVTRIGQLPKAEQTAARVLVEELEKRIGKRLPVSTTWPAEGPVVVLSLASTDAIAGHALP